jgi:SEC-C motif-containing protein
MNTEKELCPCGKTNDNNIVNLYMNCCEIAHLNHKSVNNPEQLMRSRYSAFTKAMGDYLMITHHSSTRPVNEKQDIVNWAKSVEWSQLEIIEVDTKNDTVEFKAFFYTKPFTRQNIEFIEEKSKFVNENGLWYYLGID